MATTPAPQSARNFGRVVQVTAWRESVPADPTQFSPQRQGIASAVISDLRVEFTVAHSLRRTPNESNVRIFNAAPDTRAFLESKPLVAQIAAGYADAGPRLLATGDVIFSMSELKSPNWETLLQLGDGTCNDSWARVNRAYGAGTTLRQLLQDTARSFGYSLPSNVTQDPVFDQKLPAGAHLHGRAGDELERVLQPYGLSWSVQNDVLVVLSDTDALAGAALPVDEDHGMIGTPDFGNPPRSGKPAHVKVKMELYPEIRIGGLVNVTSRTVNGVHRVERVEHRGCNLDGEFVTDIEILPMQATT